MQYDYDYIIMAAEFGKSKLFEPRWVAVFFGDPEQEVEDPYFWRGGTQAFRVMFSRDFAKESLILLLMQHIDRILKFKEDCLT